MRRAMPGPTPSMRCRIRNQARSSRGLTATRHRASRSLTWAASRNARPAVLHERELADGELDLEQVGVVRRSGTGRPGGAAGCPARSAASSRSHTARASPCSSADGDQLGSGPGGPDRDEVLVVALGGLGPDPVGDRDDLGGGAVVAGEGDHVGVEALREVEDVAHGAAPEAVDGLGVVAHGGDGGAAGREGGEDVGLEGVGVLVLVDEHVVEPRGDRRPGLGMLHQRPPQGEQVVVVDQVAGRACGRRSRRRPDGARRPGRRTTGSAVGRPRRAGSGC